MGSRHPFRVAWETRDVTVLVERLSESVVLHSPVTSTPFTGRDSVARLYEALFDVVREVEFIHELSDGGSHAFFWRAQIAGRPVEGMDLLHHDADGQVCEITVMSRPLAGAAAFAAAAGPKLARDHSALHAGLMSALARPLPGLLSLGDAAAGRLVQPEE